jgi:hypothetical protein
MLPFIVVLSVGAHGVESHSTVAIPGTMLETDDGRSVGPEEQEAQARAQACTQACLACETESQKGCTVISIKAKRDFSGYGIGPAQFTCTATDASPIRGKVGDCENVGYGSNTRR